MTSRTGTRLIVRAALAALVLGALLAPLRTAWAEGSAPSARVGGLGSDFNGDGFGDLAIGVPSEDVGTVKDAGAVHVLYGSPEGLAAAGTQFWTEDTPGIPDAAEADDGFGETVAAGDFNRDTYSDLVIGAPDESGQFSFSGAVFVLYGSAGGLSSGGAQDWTQESPGIRGEEGSTDGFGQAVTASDFNGDGFDDLALGVPGDLLPNGIRGGSANVLYGSNGGLSSSGNQLWSQDSRGVLDSAAVDEFLGWSVGSGDFDGDGFGDLAMGVIYEDVGDVDDAGAVNVLYGSSSGLTAARNQFWTEDSPGVPDRAERFDSFGLTLSAGDFDGDGFADLAVGTPLEDVGRIPDAGSVHVLPGSVAGLTSAESQFWTQDSPGVKERAGRYDEFGWALAPADYNADAMFDLAISADLENDGPVVAGGAVHVLYGSPAGLSATGNQLWTQDTPGVEDAVEEYDLFGEALRGGDYDGDRASDLAVGVPFEGLGQALDDAGAVNVLYGTLLGLSSANDQFWNQDTPGVDDMAETGDQFGWV